MNNQDVRMHELQKRAKTRKGRKKLKEEFQDLLENQGIIRKRIEEYQFQRTTLSSSYVLALSDKEKNSQTISVLEIQISDLDKKIEELHRHHKENGETLELYSKMDLYQNQKTQGWVSTLAAVLGYTGGIALGAAGLKMSYDADVSGQLVNKKTFDWTKALPIFKGGLSKKV